MSDGARDESAAQGAALQADLQAALQALAPRLQPGGGRVERLQRLSGGASQQTWAFDLASAQGLRRLILRRAPPGGGQRGSGSAGLAAEAALIARAGAAGVPVPTLVQVLAPEDGAGDGFVMDRLDGQTLGRRIVADPALHSAREQLAFQCGQALARIHALPLDDLPPLRRAQGLDEVEHYRRWHAGHGTVRPVFQLALRWLAEQAPRDAVAARLVHGDFRNGNLMVGPEGLVGVLDWELAHLGDPMEDLGWLCVNSWRFGASERPVGGFGTLAQLCAGYEAGGGRVDAARVRWWQVMGTLKWGLVCESMLAAWLSGAEREVEKAAIGRRASETEIDLLDLIAPRR